MKHQGLRGFVLFPDSEFQRRANELRALDGTDTSAASPCGLNQAYIVLYEARVNISEVDARRVLDALSILQGMPIALKRSYEIGHHETASNLQLPAAASAVLSNARMVATQLMLYEERALSVHDRNRAFYPCIKVPLNKGQTLDPASIDQLPMSTFIAGAAFCIMTEHGVATSIVHETRLDSTSIIQSRGMNDTWRSNHI